MLSTTASYLAVSNNLTRMQTATANDPQVKNDTAYFLANIGKVTSISDFVNNYRLFTYAMKAFGLEDMDYAKGLMTKVLQGGVTSSSALANTLNNSAYKAFATAFDFVGQGAAVTQTAGATTAVVSKYVEQSLEDNEGTTNQGVQLALYFQRNASSVTNAYGLLADPSMLKVVETAFGLPTGATADVDSLAKTLGNYVSVSDLQDPAKVQKIAERFTAMWDLDGNNGTNSDVSNISQIFASSSTATGVSADLLLSLQGLKLGGS